MKKFLINTGLFLLLLLAVMHLLAFTGIFQRFVLGSEIYHSINKSKKTHKKGNLMLLGDSVGRQLFDNTVFNDSINSLACNQAISMAGQYLLLKNYLEHNASTEKVVMVYNPFSLSNNLDQIYTYNYFLKPFNRAEYRPLFSAAVRQQIDKVPLHKLSNFPLVYVTNWTPTYDPKPESDLYLSPITIEYLKKIAALVKEYEIKFEIIPTPIRDSRRSEVELVQQEVEKLEAINSLFAGYFNRVPYLPDTYFSDPVHLKDPEGYTPKMIEQFL